MFFLAQSTEWNRENGCIEIRLGLDFFVEANLRKSNRMNRMWLSLTSVMSARKKGNKFHADDRTSGLPLLTKYIFRCTVVMHTTSPQPVFRITSTSITVTTFLCHVHRRTPDRVLSSRMSRRRTRPNFRYSWVNQPKGLFLSRPGSA